ncbi:LapA family protein [Latilactobacillus fuchuensis]|uniref:Lipopolysaccharide assembly protein A domain-containing protein n=1 Tax=Latilactobacillus fuchuensis TaxID=164393 RepID=A0A2N9DVP8_9LACO|nr:lipopolysaccharide assembly protein LapA domain-containing protein [Latilactobacillus fuchuensis]SPC38575.1 conserved hypothetical protein [Latilactobacillus fuchuensis]
MKKQGRLITVLGLALIVVIFAVLNVAPVAVNFGFAHVQWPLIIVIIVSLLIGAIITFLAATGSTLSQKKMHKQLTQELAKVQAEQAETVQKAVDAATAKAQKQFDQALADKEAEVHELHAKINQISQTSDHHNA